MGARMRNLHGNNDEYGESGSGELDVDEERQKLSQLNALMIVDYVKSSFDILLNLRVEDALYD